LVVSCDGYSDLWAPFFERLFTYWPDCPCRVFLGTNSKTYPDHRVTPLIIGPDQDYSSNLLAMLDRIDHEWILVSVEDVLLSALVQTSRFQKILDFARTHGGVHVQLLLRRFNPMALAINRLPESPGLGEFPATAPYRASISFGLWRKDALVAMLRRGESAWEFEQNAAIRPIDGAWRFFALVESQEGPLVRFVHGVLKGMWTREGSAAAAEHRQAHPKCRPVQLRRSGFYLSCYVMARYVVIASVFAVRGVPGMLALMSWYRHRIGRR
jgi:hypothetical protein